MSASGKEAREKPRATTFGCGFLYAAATDAYDRCKELGSSPRDHIDSYDPFVSIVFAAAAVEVFLNDAIEMALLDKGVKRGPLCAQFGAVGKFLRERRASSREKVELAYVIFTGKPPDRGANPYQDWALLAVLRNKLMHMQPEGYYEFEEDDMSKGGLVCPKVIDGLRSKNILDDSGRKWASWHPTLLTAAVAKWACIVSADMVEALTGIADQPFRRMLDSLAGVFRNKRPDT